MGQIYQLRRSTTVAVGVPNDIFHYIAPNNP